MIIVGISGKRKSGKDTVCEMIRDILYTWKVERIGFADELKREIGKACGVTVEYMESNKETFRKIYQWWGTDFKRNLIRQDYWIQCVLQQITKLDKSVQCVVIPDVRFLNEADMIDKVGGHLIRINRNRASPDSLDVHSSETELDNYPFKYTVENNGAIAHLNVKVKSILTKILNENKIKCTSL